MTFSLSLLGFGMPGMQEILVVAVIVLVLFGSSKLPLFMRNLGRSANEFKKGMKDSLDEDGNRKDESPAS
ncbi:MAG: twin-arginine translocase TatA/TatE family subunit [Planctomycetota bacterium]